MERGGTIPSLSFRPMIMKNFLSPRQTQSHFAQQQDSNLYHLITEGSYQLNDTVLNICWCLQ